MNRLVTTTSGALLLVAALLPGREGQARTLTVDCAGGAEFLTVQAAVDSAASGDSIQVAPCTYEESVELQGKILTILGGGSGTTVLTGAGLAPTIQNTTSLTLRDLRIEKHAQADYAILCDENELTLSHCVVKGSAKVGKEFGAIDIEQSSLTWISVTGGNRGGSMRNSHFGGGFFSGVWLAASNSYVSEGCSYGRISLGPLAIWGSTADSIGSVIADGTVDIRNEFSAINCVIDTCLAVQSPSLSLLGCTIRDFGYEAAFGGGPFLELERCLFLSDCPVRLPNPKGITFSGPRAGASFFDGYSIEHNTILGRLDVAVQEFFDPPVEVIRSNLVLGETTINIGSQPLITHNDFAGGSMISAPVATVENNLEADPQLCAPEAGNYKLDGASPCLGAAHDGGNIGAFDIGCQIPVVSTTWGRLKAKF